MFEYKSIAVKIKMSGEKDGNFQECMDIVQEQAKEGWRLVQIVVPPNEKMGIMMAYAYQIVLEKEV